MGIDVHARRRPVMDGLLRFLGSWRAQEQAYEAMQGRIDAEENAMVAQGATGAIGAIGSAPFQARSYMAMQDRELANRLALIGATSRANISQREAQQFIDDFGMSPETYARTMVESGPAEQRHAYDLAEQGDFSPQGFLPGEPVGVAEPPGEGPPGPMGPPEATGLEEFFEATEGGGDPGAPGGGGPQPGAPFGGQAPAGPEFRPNYRYDYTPRDLKQLAMLDQAKSSLLASDKFTDEQKAMGLQQLAARRSQVKPTLMRVPDGPPSIDDAMESGQFRIMGGSTVSYDPKSGRWVTQQLTPGLEKPLKIMTPDGRVIEMPAGVGFMRDADGWAYTRDFSGNHTMTPPAKDPKGADRSRQWMAARAQATKEFQALYPVPMLAKKEGVNPDQWIKNKTKELYDEQVQRGGDLGGDESGEAEDESAGIPPPEVFGRGVPHSSMPQTDVMNGVTWVLQQASAGADVRREARNALTYFNRAFPDPSQIDPDMKAQLTMLRKAAGL